MGKPKDNIWQQWTDCGDNKVECRNCKKHKIEKHATRCRLHTSLCSSTPKRIREIFTEKVKSLQQLRKQKPSGWTGRIMEEGDVAIVEDHSRDFDVEEINQAGVAVSSTSVAVFPTPSPSGGTSSSAINSVLTGRINRISSSKMKELQLLWAKAIISGNVAFEWTQNPFLQNFFANLGSGFLLPSRKEISGSILKILDVESKEKRKICIDNQKCFSLVPDGWTNICGLSVINIMLVNPIKCILWDSFQTGEEKETGIYIQGNLEKAINKIEETYGRHKIVAVVSDQGSNFLFARNAIARTSSILSINCAAHMLNLLASDRRLGEYNAEFERYISEEKDKGNNPSSLVSLSIPSPTRWFGIRDMLYKLDRAKPVLMRLSIKDDTDISFGTKKTLRDEAFWSKLLSVRPLFLAITDAIAIVESNASCISDVVEEFEKLRQIFQPAGHNHNMLKEAVNLSEIRICIKSFEKRSTDDRITSIHYLANLLDPRYRGRTFKDDEHRLVLTLEELQTYAESLGVIPTESLKEELGNQITNFRMKEGLFNSTMLSHRLPFKYWDNMRQFQSTSLLAGIAVRLLSIPASSAAVERSFSRQGNVHTKTRNILTHENVNRLMCIKWNLNDDLELGRDSSKLESELVECVDDNECDQDIDELIYLDTPFNDDELLAK
ncbi:hypothetical protein Fcan01_27767 [Folsomia candida]|uniref:HAT C-terminal dimerisation domain-containing protein n=1 Tax=Folsomia candida TaxID=158441 RepID=A0A226CX06_FOLCA|nr:hypothetical protein Fcan01_27767 [Folsomia candida]